MTFKQAQIRAAQIVRKLTPYAGKEHERCYACGEQHLVVKAVTKFEFETYLTPTVAEHLEVTCSDCGHKYRRGLMRCESVPKGAKPVNPRGRLRLRE